MAFVEEKSPDLGRIRQLLEAPARHNHWTNRGPLHRVLAQAFHEYLGLGSDRAVVPCANGGIALETLARLHDARLGKRLRWVVSSFSFWNLGRGYFSTATAVDCDAQGLLSLDELAALPLDAYDGIVVINPFGLCRDFDRYRDFVERHDKTMLLDNAAGVRRSIPEVDYQSLSLHHTKPYGAGEGGLAVLNPFDELIGDLTSKPALAGVIAHFHFVYGDGSRGDPDTDWSEISRAILGKDIERPYRYSLCMENDSARCPFYINYGVFIGTPDLLKEFHRGAIQLQPKVFQTTKSWFVAQITVPLVCAALELPTRSLPMRYNFPNDELADTMYPEEMEDMRFFHYLRTHEFDRHKVFSDEEYFDVFMNRGMKASNEIFRRRVHELTQGRYPFGESDNGIPANFSNKIDESSRWMRLLQSITCFRR